MNLKLLSCNFDPQAYWTNPLPENYPIDPQQMDLFDQNGYDLSRLEIAYSQVNHGLATVHRNAQHVALKQPWFTQIPQVHDGAILNHALIFERKGYQGPALQQLESWAKTHPIIHKLVKYRPKWGIDFSMDWADRQGNVFELLHYEFDSFDFAEIQQVKATLEPLLLGIDWQQKGQQMLACKHEWHGLDFFAQSDYKCGFFGLPSERFKMVAWQ